MALTKTGSALLALACLSSFAALGCATESPFVWVDAAPIVEQDPAAIHPRDTILVSVQNQPALSGEFTIGDQGEYLHPTLGTVSVSGKTVEQVKAEIVVRLKDIVVKPEVTVSITKVAPIRVNVVGEVKTPGTYELVRGRGVVPALAAAGWLNEFADRDRIFVIRTEGGVTQRIRFRSRALTNAEPHAVAFRLKDGDVVVVD